MAKLEFGTAGIRGKLGPGEANLNLAHIYRVTEGYARYLLKKIPEAKTKGIVIGRDNRRQSAEFAAAAAAVLKYHGIRVHYSKNICPTPFISFAIKKLGALGGINITASHNPKEFNGYKIYNGLGAQMLPSEIADLVKFFEPYENYLTAKFTTQFTSRDFIQSQIFDQYQQAVGAIGGQNFNLSNLKIAFSPLHGTGADIGQKLFNDLKLNVCYATNEMSEDPEFSYVKNPNPESIIAFEGVIKACEKQNVDLFLVTDPDADRLGVIVNDVGVKRILTGNDVATIITYYLVNHKNAKILSNSYLIYSLVSSSLPKIIAQKHHVKPVAINTGFKWVAEAIAKNQDKEFLYAFEESYGGLLNPKISYDKDALQIMIMICKIASYYKTKKLNLFQLLQQINTEYGYAKTGVVSIDLQSLEPAIWERIKTKLINHNYGFAKLKVTDFNHDVTEIAPDNMIKIEFENNSWIILRPSGTEPKIKIYLFTFDRDENIAQNMYELLIKQIKNEIE
ncbi:phospho-sugar mutase [Candidatus Mycoplasma pogonae]